MRRCRSRRSRSVYVRSSASAWPTSSNRLLTHHYLPALLTDHENGKRIRQHGTARGTAATPTLRRRSPGGRRGRRGWRRTVLGGHRQNVVRLAIERQRLGAHHGLQILLHHETGRIVLLDDGHGAVAVRAEDFHGGRIEHRAI